MILDEYKKILEDDIKANGKSAYCYMPAAFTLKLIEVAEAAKDVAENPHNNFDKILILRGKLQELEKE